MNYEQEYQELEQGFVQYADKIKINKFNPETDGERFITLPKQGQGVVGRYVEGFNGMEALFPEVLVREGIFEKLLAIDKAIKGENPNWQLQVTEGYRALEIQTQKHQEQLARFNALYPNDPQYAKAMAHAMIADPMVAGHPTGGAVDVLIPGLDFGTEIYDLSKKSYVMSPEVDKQSQAHKNRLLLREIMESQGFAPYDGEWWHFSYGDREWASLLGFDEFLYSQKEFEDVELKR